MIKNVVKSASYRDEHLTPLEISSALSPILLDPFASQNSKLGQIINYTKEDDGFSKDWHGLFYLANPPFSQKERAIAKCKANPHGILLLPESSETEWHQDLVFFCGEYFQIGKRLKFGGNKSFSQFPTSLFPFGDEARYRIKNSGLAGKYLKMEWAKRRAI